MKSSTNPYAGYRYPSEIIVHAVWVYHRFCLSFRDVEELLAERGVLVSYETIRQWCYKFGPSFAKADSTAGTTDARVKSMRYVVYCLFIGE